MLPRLARLLERLARRAIGASAIFTLEHLKTSFVSWSTSRATEDVCPTEPGFAGLRPPADWLDRVRRGAPRLLESRPQRLSKPDPAAADAGQDRLLAAPPARTRWRRPRPIVETTLQPARRALPLETTVASTAEHPTGAAPPMSCAQPLAVPAAKAQFKHAGYTAPPAPRRRPSVAADLGTTMPAMASRLPPDGEERGTPGSAAMHLLGEPASIGEARADRMLRSRDVRTRLEGAGASGAAAGHGRTLERDVTVQQAIAPDLDWTSSPARSPGSQPWPALPRWPGGPTHARRGAWPDLPHRPWPRHAGEMPWSA